MEYLDVFEFIQISVFSNSHYWIQVFVGLWLLLTLTACLYHSDFKNLVNMGIALFALLMIHYGIDGKALLSPDFLWVIIFTATAQTMQIVRWALIQLNCKKISNLLKYRTALVTCFGISCAFSWLITSLI